MTNVKQINYMNSMWKILRTIYKRWVEIIEMNDTLDYIHMLLKITLKRNVLNSIIEVKQVMSQLACIWVSSSSF